MAENLQLFFYGAAAVLDLVVLLSLLERPNWQSVTVWMLSLTIGVCLWHSGLFVKALLAHSTGELAPYALWGSMSVMAGGLLLMPCAMLHGLHRFNRSGMQVSIRPHPWLLLYYLPVLLLVPISFQLATDPRRPFLELLHSWAGPYLVFNSTTNLVVAFGLWRLRRTVESPSVLLFFGSMAWTLLTMTIVNLSALTWITQLWPAGQAWLQTGVALTPVVPTLVFAYFVLRFQLLPLVLERTLTYGAIVIGAMLLHEVMTHDLAEALQEQYRVNFGLMEGTAALGLILVYQPLRQRCLEALRYLFSSSAQHRDHHRQLSVQLATRSGEAPQELLDWFTHAARSIFRVEYVWAGRFEPDGHPVASNRLDPHIPIQTAQRLHHLMHSQKVRTCTLYDAPSRACLLLLQETNASAALLLDCPDRPGLVLVGPQRFRQSLGNEELNALVLLVEQLGATIQNAELQAARREAERRAVQQEKLSSLGLIAGSIAHEVKNPLSSIKSIATVLAEELGEHSPHAEDLRLILSEVNRLALTTSQLLDIARSPAHSPRDGQIAESLRQTIQLLSHLAKQRHVQISLEMPDELPVVTGDEGALREIFLNLIVNAIEAAGSNGSVQIRCCCDGAAVTTEVRDDGPGLPVPVRERLFEPLITTKEKGTGLGLYVVGLRVRDCGGSVTCESVSGRGTSFVVRLPLLENRTAS